MLLKLVSMQRCQIKKSRLNTDGQFYRINDSYQRLRLPSFAASHIA